jgi:hypothetical protein
MGACAAEAGRQRNLQCCHKPHNTAKDVNSDDETHERPGLTIFPDADTPEARRELDRELHPDDPVLLESDRGRTEGTLLDLARIMIRTAQSLTHDERAEIRGDFTSHHKVMLGQMGISVGGVQFSGSSFEGSGMTPEEISKLVFVLYPHVVRSSPDVNLTESLAARIKGMLKGLEPEDEFAANSRLVGNCAAIHGIDQLRCHFHS